MWSLTFSIYFCIVLFYISSILSILNCFSLFSLLTSFFDSSNLSFSYSFFIYSFSCFSSLLCCLKVWSCRSFYGGFLAENIMSSWVMFVSIIFSYANYSSGILLPESKNSTSLLLFFPSRLICLSFC